MLAKLKQDMKRYKAELATKENKDFYAPYPSGYTLQDMRIKYEAAEAFLEMINKLPVEKDEPVKSEPTQQQIKDTIAALKILADDGDKDALKSMKALQLLIN